MIDISFIVLVILGIPIIEVPPPPTPPPAIEEKHWVDGLATAYYGANDTLNGGYITATGYNIRDNTLYKGYHIIATDPSIPFGTLIEIQLEDNSLIQAVVLDRGGGINGNHLDIVFSNKKECFNFGRQAIKYRIIGKVD